MTQKRKKEIKKKNAWVSQSHWTINSSFGGDDDGDVDGLIDVSSTVNYILIYRPIFATMYIFLDFSSKEPILNEKIDLFYQSTLALHLIQNKVTKNKEKKRSKIAQLNEKSKSSNDLIKLLTGQQWHGNLISCPRCQHTQFRTRFCLEWVGKLNMEMTASTWIQKEKPQI